MMMRFIITSIMTIMVSTVGLAVPKVVYGEWSELAPAVEEIDLHLRVEARSGSVFGIDIAEGDTGSWHRYEARLPGVWPDDVHTSMGVKIEFITVTDREIRRDSTATAKVFAEGRNSTPVSIKISGNPRRALLEMGGKKASFEHDIELSDSNKLFVRFFSDKKAEIVRDRIAFEAKAAKEKEDDVDEIK